MHEKRERNYEKLDTEGLKKEGKNEKRRKQYSK